MIDRDSNIELSLNVNHADNMNGEKKNTYFAGGTVIKKSISFYLIIGALLLLSTGSVHAQFVVQPGKIELSLESRQQTDTVMTIHNYDKQRPLTLDLKLLELTQRRDGEWLPVDTDPNNIHDYYPTMDISKFSSCNSWLKLEKNVIEINPNDDVILTLKIKVPPRVSRGYYFAAVVVSTEINDESTGHVPMVVRVVVPVIANVNVEERPSWSKIDFKEINLEYEPGENGFGGKTLATAIIKNNGVTFPRLVPIVRIRGFYNGKWRLIATHKFNDIGIIPGVELELKSDIGKSLPSAKYQLEGALYVDGRISKRIGKFEMNYIGDPLVTQAMTEVPLDLVPYYVALSAKPGSSAYGNITIYNAASEQVEIVSKIGFPKDLAGKSVGQTKVSDMSCEKWVNSTQEALTLPGNGNRNLRIKAEMPEEALQLPYYYAELNLKAVYSDGESAGQKTALICLTNENVKDVEPEVKFLMLDIRELNPENSVYTVLVGFVNEGKVHIVPKRCTAQVAAADGFGRTFATLKSNKDGVLLPSEGCTYSGNIDFSGVDPGDYHLEVLLEHASGRKSTKQITLNVSVENGVKVPRILQQDLKSNEIIQIKW